MAGQDRCQRGIGRAHPSPSLGGGSAPLGPRVPGPSRPVRAGSGRCSSPAPLPHPHRGDLSRTGARRRVGAAVATPGLARPPHQGRGPSPAGPGSEGQGRPRPRPHELRKRLVPTSPTEVCTGAPDPQKPVTDAPRGASAQERALQECQQHRGREEAGREPSVPSTDRCCLLRPHTSTSAPTVW